MIDAVFDVSGAVAALNQTLDYAFPNITVVGELANYKVAKGRWIYADIKDDNAKLRLFGTVYDLPVPLSDGMVVQVFSRPQIHPQFGFSLNIMNIKPVGEGSIKKAADLLRIKLEKEGLFDPARKRTVPYPPDRIGLITSAESAAYADFTKILNARWLGVQVEVFDAQVQGEAAVESIISGIRYFNQHSEPPEALVVIRGGGSADDLAAFSAEQTVRAVAGSRIPTCVAIGHEVDISLAELAADMRASTPSNAAELLFPDRAEVLNRLGLKNDQLTASLVHRLEEKEALLNTIKSDLIRSVEAALETKSNEMKHAKTLLEAIHPKATLKRGYALVQTESGKLVSTKRQLSVGDSLRVTLQDGGIDTKVEKV